MDRAEFEKWAGREGSRIDEDDDTYTLMMFGDSPLVCPKSDTSVTSCLARDYYWESWISLWFLREFDPMTVFVDIGSNSGYYSVMAAHRGVKAFAIEANPSYIPLLEKTSSLQNRPFDVIHAAVTDRSGTATLRIPGPLEGSASIRSEFDFSMHDEYSKDVPARTLDSLDIPCEGKVLVKVDAEGAEESIWDGAAEFINKHSPVFVIEYTPGAYTPEFTDKLRAYGSITYIDDAGDEKGLNVDSLQELTDWKMLVVRKV